MPATVPMMYNTPALIAFDRYVFISFLLMYLRVRVRCN